MGARGTEIPLIRRRSEPRAARWWLLSAALLPVLVAAPAAAVVELSSHRAVYDVATGKTASDSPVKSVVGRTSFMMQRYCDGWKAVEDYAISFSLDGGQSNYISHFESWESINGRAFSFTVHENSSLSGQAQYNGFAHHSNGSSEAYFVNGEDSTMELPDDTVFPITHMARLLERARNGSKFTQSNLFHGGDEEDSLYRVSSVIGNRKTERDPALGALAEEGYWPVRLAYFDPASLEGSPDYEIELAIQDNGVIRSYIVDYGDFSMSGSLETVERLAEPEC